MSKTYKKDGVSVLTSNMFLYEESIYKRTPRSFSLIRLKTYTSEKPIERNKREVKNEDYQYNPETRIAIIRFWELMAAPEEYLIKNNYKLV